MWPSGDVLSSIQRAADRSPVMVRLTRLPVRTHVVACGPNAARRITPGRTDHGPPTQGKSTFGPLEPSGKAARARFARVSCGRSDRRAACRTRPGQRPRRSAAAHRHRPSRPPVPSSGPCPTTARALQHSCVIPDDRHATRSLGLSLPDREKPQRGHPGPSETPTDTRRYQATDENPAA